MVRDRCRNIATNSDFVLQKDWQLFTFAHATIVRQKKKKKRVRITSGSRVHKDDKLGPAKAVMHRLPFFSSRNFPGREERKRKWVWCSLRGSLVCVLKDQRETLISIICFPWRMLHYYCIFKIWNFYIFLSTSSAREFIENKQLKHTFYYLHNKFHVLIKKGKKKKNTSKDHMRETLSRVVCCIQTITSKRDKKGKY